MKDGRYLKSLYPAVCAVWLAVLLVLLERDPASWEILVMQVTVFAAMLGCCIEAAAAKSKAPLVFMLVLAVVVGILMHATFYRKIGLVMSADAGLSYPGWRDALYFSVVTFTTLGYGDMAPREEYRLVAAFEAIYGYLALGALAGMAVALFNRQPG